jgi:N-methylhydantoinase A/oxoprolinase/acetone carboxylase beta subunit
MEKDIHPTSYLLGIDTGGTYTDGVLLDESTRQVMATTKTLTTKPDLSECILKALDNLLPQDPGQIRLVSISTTLATNAIAEGKGRPVGLFLLGYDPDLVEKFSLDEHFATSSYHFFTGGHTLHGEEQTPLGLSAILERAHAIKDQVEAFAVSGYFSPFNSSHEERSFEALREALDHPVVLGHQLSSKLNSVQRAATATLNASLISVIQEFVLAIRSALDERHITAPLMVVRGDGGLMNAGIAEERPVETVHSGPAASAIGARFLSKQEKALVIDIGGTTTDIAIIDQGQVNVKADGTSVGKFSTAVRAADVRSIGLGGDSQISFDIENRLVIHPHRVTPIAYLAHTHPQVAKHLQSLPHRESKRISPDLIEYWFLQREPRRLVQNDLGRDVIELLRLRPMTLPDILERLGLFHPLQFGGQALIQQEIIGRAALTPTDLLHLTGEYSPWDQEAAQITAAFMAGIMGLNIDQLVENVMVQIAEKITAEVVAFTSGQSLKRTPCFVKSDDLGLWLFEENISQENPYLGSTITLKMPIIGIGAPAKIFLPRVAELLHTELITPPHFQVANAVGAVSGSVIAIQEAWVIPQMNGMNLVGYSVQIGKERKRFSQDSLAIAFAKQIAGEKALTDARAAGATEIQLEIEQLHDGAESYRFQARAIGNPALG